METLSYKVSDVELKILIQRAISLAGGPEALGEVLGLPTKFVEAWPNELWRPSRLLLEQISTFVVEQVAYNTHLEK